MNRRNKAILALQLAAAVLDVEAHGGTIVILAPGREWTVRRRGGDGRARVTRRKGPPRLAGHRAQFLVDDV